MSIFHSIDDKIEHKGEGAFILILNLTGTRTHPPLGLNGTPLIWFPSLLRVARFSVGTTLEEKRKEPVSRYHGP